QVIVNAASLPPGVFSGSVTVQNTPSGPSSTVKVSLVVLSSGPSIALTQTGLLFTTVDGSKQLPPQSFGLSNGGLGQYSWTIHASTLAGAGWLQVPPSSGTATAGTSGPTPVQVSVNASGLDGGQYYGLIEVDAPDAKNNPQVI